MITHGYMDSLGGHENILIRLDCGDGCTTMSIY